MIPHGAAVAAGAGGLGPLGPADAADLGAARPGQGHRVGHRRAGAARRPRPAPALPASPATPIRRWRPSPARPTARCSSTRALAAGVGRRGHLRRRLPGRSTRSAAMIAAADVVVLPYDSRRPGHLRACWSTRSPPAARSWPPPSPTPWSCSPAVPGWSSPSATPRPWPRRCAGCSPRTGLADRMAAEARRLAPSLAWPAVADALRRAGAARWPTSGRRSGHDRPDARAATTWCALTDRPAPSSTPRWPNRRREHGYCTDDVARVLVVTAREPDALADGRGSSRDGALRFLADAQDPTGATRNRRSADGRWHGRHRVEDAWGRSLWGLGRRVPRRRVGRPGRARRLRARRRAALALAALDGLRRPRRRPGAHGRPLEPRRPRRCSTTRPCSSGALTGDRRWPWPEDRLSYANAVLPEAMIAAGHRARPARARATRAWRCSTGCSTGDGRRPPVGQLRRRGRARRPGARLRPAADRGGGPGRRLRARRGGRRRAAVARGGPDGRRLVRRRQRRRRADVGPARPAVATTGSWPTGST